MQKIHSLAAFYIAFAVFGNTQAAPLFQVTQNNLPSSPLALLDDGQYIIAGRIDYDPNFPCGGAYGCTPVILYAALNFATPNQIGTEIPYNFKDRVYQINSKGFIATWSSTSGQDYSTLNLATGTSTPFAASSKPPVATCGKYVSPYNYWWALSNSNVLVGKPTGDCINNAIFLWNGQSDAQQVLPPKGYGAVRFAGVNTSNQMAITASQITHSPPYTTKALIWKKAGGYKVLPTPFISLLKGFTGNQSSTAINDNGDILGNISKPNGEQHATLWQGSKAIDIGTLPGYKNSMAIALTSESKVIACAYNTYDPTYGPSGTTELFVWTNGVTTKWSDATSGSAQNIQGCTDLIIGYSLKPNVLTNGRGQVALITGVGNSYLVSPIPSK